MARDFGDGTILCRHNRQWPEWGELMMEHREHTSKAVSRTVSIHAKHTGGDPTTVYLVAAGVALCGLILTIFVG
jgi:hypothetical protein